MARRAQLADGRILEFPDGTSDAVIQKVVKQQIAATRQQDTFQQRQQQAVAAFNKKRENERGYIGQFFDWLTGTELEKPKTYTQEQVGAQQQKLAAERQKYLADAAKLQKEFDLINRNGGRGAAEMATSYSQRIKLAMENAAAAAARSKLLGETGVDVPEASYAREMLGALPRTAVETTLALPGVAGEFLGRGVSAGAGALNKLTGGQSEALGAVQRAGQSARDLGLAQQKYVEQGSSNVFGAPAEALQYNPNARLAADISGGVGSLLPFMAPSKIAAAAGVGKDLAAVQRAEAITKAARPYEYGLGIGQGAQQGSQDIQAYEQRTKQKVPDANAFAAILINAGLGATEVGVASRIFESIPVAKRGAAMDAVANAIERASRGKVNPTKIAKAVGETLDRIESRAAGRVAVSAAEEALQEGGTQLGTNLAAQQLYDPNRSAFEDVGYNALVGGIVGGGTRAGVEGMDYLGRRAAANKFKADALAGQERLATYTIATTNKNDPTQTTQEDVHVRSMPDEDGNVVVEMGDGSLKRMPMEELEARRVDTGTRNVPEAFSRPAVAQRLAASLGNTEPDEGLTTYINTVNKRLTDAMATRDPAAAETYLDEQLKTLKKARLPEETKIARMLVLDEARNIHNEFLDSMTAPEGPVPVAGRTFRSETPGLQPGEEQEGAEGYTPPTPPPPRKTIADELAEKEQERQSEQQKRMQLLEMTLEAPVSNHLSAFENLMALHGFTPNADEVAFIKDWMREQSEAETQTGQEKTQELGAQEDERNNIIADTLRRGNLDTETKISKINAELMRARQEPLTDAEIERIQKVGTAADVFGPKGEFEQRDEASVAEEEPPVEEPLAEEEQAPEEDFFEEDDYEDHPFMQEHDQRYDDAINDMGNAGNMKEFRKMMAEYQKDGLIDEDDVNEINSLLEGIPNAEKLDEALAALEEALENQRENKREDVAENIKERLAAAEEEDTKQPARDPHDVVLEEIENAWFNENGEFDPQIDEKAYKRLIAAAEGKKHPVEKIRAELKKAKDRYAEHLMRSVLMTKEESEAYTKKKESVEAAKQRLRNALAKLGFKDVLVIVKDLVEGGSAGGSYNAMDSIIRVAMDDHATMEGILYHELIHYLKDHGFFKPHEWQALVRFANKDIALRSLLRVAYRKDTKAVREEERVAEVFRAWMRNREGLPIKTTAFNRVQKFLNAIRDFFFSQNLRDANAVMEAIANGEFATREDMGSQRKREMKDVGPRYMYKGVSARDADMGKLAQAKAAEARGEDVSITGYENIKNTGWFKAPDGGWRFWSGDRDSNWKKGEFEKLNKGDTRKLVDIYDHPELFAAYPKLRNITVKFDDTLDAGTGGSWSASQNTIRLNANAYMGHPDAARRTLIHEIQHAVQTIEKWARGGSPESNPGYAEPIQLAEALASRLERESTGGFPTDAIHIYNDAIHELGRNVIPRLDQLHGQTAVDFIEFLHNNSKTLSRDQIFKLEDVLKEREQKRSVAESLRKLIETSGRDDLANVGDAFKEVKPLTDLQDQIRKQWNRRKQELAAEATAKNAPRIYALIDKVEALNNKLVDNKEERSSLGEKLDEMEQQYSKMTADGREAPEGFFDEFTRMNAREKELLTERNDLAEQRRTLMEELDTLNNPDFTQEYEKNWKPQLDALDKQIKKIGDARLAQEQFSRGLHKLRRQYADLGWMTYEQLLGEIEARDAAARLDNDSSVDIEGGEFIPYEHDDFGRGLSPANEMILNVSDSDSYSRVQAPPLPGGNPASPSQPSIETLGFSTDLKGRLSRMKSNLIRKINDKYRGGVDYSRALAAVYGVTRLPDNMNVANKFALLESRKIGNQMSLKRWYLDPLEDKIKELGLDPQDVGMYLWARSAKDRNALVRKRTDGETIDGSGMTDADAKGVIDHFLREGLLPDLKKVAKLYDSLIDYMGNERVKAGMISKEEWKRLRDEQPFYAPLKGAALEGDMNEDGDPKKAMAEAREEYQKMGGRTRISEFLKAKGRENMPFNPLFTAMSDAQFAIARIERNRVAQTLLDNALSDSELHKGVVKVYSEKKVPGATMLSGQALTKMRERASDGSRVGDRAFVVKKGGDTFYLDFQNTNAGNTLYRAFSNMTPKELGKFMIGGDITIAGKTIHIPGIMQVSNNIKSLKTRFNPSYILGTAWQRDFQEAILTNLAAQSVKGGPAEGKKIAAKSALYMFDPRQVLVVGNYLAGRDMKSEKNAELTLLFDQFLKDGGAVGHTMIESAQDRVKTFSKALSVINQLQNKRPDLAALEMANAGLDFLDALSQVMDMQARFATYRAALDAKIDRDNAAMLALDSSLDLTRRGELAPYLDTWFFFWSAGVEGGRKFIKQGLTMRNARWTIGAAFKIGILLQLWNSFMGGDDDDDGRKNILDVSDTVRQTRGVMYIPKWLGGTGKTNDYVAIPTAFSLGFAKYAGEQFMQAMQGDITPSEAGVTIANAFREMALPVRGSSSKDWGYSVLSALLPDITQPLIDVAANANYFGSPIYRENKFDEGPRSEMGREDTPAIWKWLAQGANSITGGTSTVSGGFSRQPEWFEYLANQYGGGLFDVGAKGLQGKVPDFFKLSGKGGEFAPMNNFYKNTENMDQIYKSYKDMEEGEDEAAFEENKQKFPVQANEEVLDAYDVARKELKDIRKDYREGGYSSIEDYHADMNEVYKAFNRIFNETKKEHQRSK